MTQFRENLQTKGRTDGQADPISKDPSGQGRGSNKSLIFHYIHVNSFASFVIYTYFLLSPASFLFSIKLCRSVSNFLIMFSKQTKVFWLDWMSPVFSLFVNHFEPSLGKMSKQFTDKHQYQRILIFSVTQLGKIRLKCNSSDTDIGIQMTQSKKKRKGKTASTFLLFILLTLDSCMPSQSFYRVRAKCNS